MNPIRTILPPLALVPIALSMAGAQAARFPANPRVDAIFAEWNTADGPGCSLGVVRDGKFVYQKGYGMANLDYDIANDPRLVYYVGSVSKQFTAAAIALLVLDGRIGLDDDIRKYFPEMPVYSRPVTVRHMVHHTSGLRDIYGIMDLAGKRMEDVFTDAEAIALIASQKETNFTPGSEYLYSNSGYFLLGQLVKRVTGTSLRAFADERIFRPLGMTDTHFHDDPGHIMKRRAMSYEPGPGGRGYRISYVQNFDKIGAGGLYTTLADLLKWDANYYSHTVGGARFQQMVHTRGVLTNGDTLPYAFGNNVERYRGLRITEHAGALMGYKAELLRFPDQRFSTIILCNYGPIDPARLAFAVSEVYLGDRMGAGASRSAPAAPAPRPARRMGTAATDAALAGAYHSEEVNATYTVRADGGTLLLVRPLRVDTLEAMADGTYRAGNLHLTFTRSAGQPATSFTIEAGRVRNIRFVRRG
jgi:CubicO group peptidase (beta-lactamase class C family)